MDRRSTNSYKWGKVGNEVIDSEVYPMWVADMEFKVSPHIIKRLQDRINQGIFGYERLSDEYYNAVIYWLNNKHSYNVTKNEIVYCANTMVGISVFIQSFTYEGEGVLVNTPVYGNFYNSIKGCGRKIIESPLIEYNGRYTFDFNDMSSKITDNTKILLICNPHNPTGSVWNKSELIELCRFCKKHNLLLVSDEVHFDFIFNNVKHTATALVANEIGVKIATIISPGKSFNVAGIQSASIIINDECMRKKYIKVMEDMMYPFAHAFAEAVTIGAYKESEKWLCEVLEYINENRKVFIQFFQEKLPKIKIAQSDSTYLIWVDCRGLRLSDEKLNKLWDEKCKLILSHGSEFGNNYSQFRRFNIACPKDKLIDILNRIEKVFKEEGYIDKR
ncbi:MAG: PatB family C-S lyase [Clostridium sp.]